MVGSRRKLGRQEENKIGVWRMEMEEALLIGSLSPGPAKKKEKNKKEIKCRETPSRPSSQSSSDHWVHIYIWACWLVYQPLLLSTDLKPIEQRVTIGELKNRVERVLPSSFMHSD